MNRFTRLLGAQRAATGRAAASSGASVSALGQGMDLAVSAIVFLGLGVLLDRWLGTRPLFMIALVVLALVGQGIRMWYAYDAAMRRLEQERIDRRNGQVGT